MASKKQTLDSFSGFPEQTVSFLRDLANNNDKAWFEAHRDDYERYFVAPARMFVSAMGAPLRAISEGIQAVPKINGSLMRIHRDTRFSKDKTPYKTHLDLMFWEGEGRARECPAFVFRLTADSLIVGAGKHGFDKDGLAAYRAAVADDTQGSALQQAIAEVTESGAYELRGEVQKRLPRGYPKDHARESLLRHKSIYIHKDLGHPAELRSAQCVDLCIQHYRAMAPLHQWLIGLHD